jgi:hypothetical protein
LKHPILQPGHVPSYKFGLIATLSPTLNRITPLPTSSTVPLNSWPNVTGRVSPVMGCGCIGMPIGPAMYSLRSRDDMSNPFLLWKDADIVHGINSPLPQIPTNAGRIWSFLYQHRY